MTSSQAIEVIREAAARVFPEVVQLRRELHRCPELAFEEFDTARLIHQTLSQLELPVQTGVAGTGLVASIRGAGPGPTVLLRADLDALPIHESTGLDFASEREGLMHACGHDFHTASLLGTAMILNDLRPHFRGTVRLVFQPSEERLPGGAAQMIREGVLDPNGDELAVEAAFAQHVMPGMPAGTLGIRPGAFMASADEIYITVTARGGHAAMPHRMQADAVLAASHVVVALQSVISRNCPPNIPSVLSFGKILAEGATNVIPDSVQLEGTFRAMDEDWRYSAHEMIRRVANSTAQAFGASARVDITVGYPALHNDPGLAQFVLEAARDYVDEEAVIDADQWFASEDFAYFLQSTKGVFYTLGVGNTGALHTAQFNPDETALRTGCGFMAYLAWKNLSG